MQPSFFPFLEPQSHCILTTWNWQPEDKYRKNKKHLINIYIFIHFHVTNYVDQTVYLNT